MLRGGTCLGLDVAVLGTCALWRELATSGAAVEIGVWDEQRYPVSHLVDGPDENVTGAGSGGIGSRRVPRVERAGNN